MGAKRLGRIFRSPRGDRFGTRLSAEGVLDMALRGNEKQWWKLYHAVQTDAELRVLMRRMLVRADPDLRGGIALWTAILDRREKSGGATSGP